MVEVPDTLRCLFSATLEQRDGQLLLTVPQTALEHDVVMPDTSYRIAVLAQSAETMTPQPTRRSLSDSPDRHDQTDAQPQGPPVEEGEIRDVTIEAIGDQGDGIAKVERGYVLIIPDTQPDRDVTVEIERVRANVAFAQVIEDES